MIAWQMFVGICLCSAVSIPLYCRIVFALMKRPEFGNSPFYRLICVNAVLDISHCVLTTVFYQLPMFGPTMDLFVPSADQQPSRLISLVIVAYFSLIYQIIFLHVAIALNRLTAIFWPFKHKILWEQWWPAFPVVGLILSLVFTFHRIFSTGKYAQINSAVSRESVGNFCGYTPMIASYDLYSLNQNLLTALVGSAALFGCMFINGLTFYKVWRRRREQQRLTVSQMKQQHQQQGNSFRHEIHLFFISLWMCVFMSIFIVFEIALFANTQGYILPLMPWASTSGQVSCYLFNQMPWVEALFSLSQPWVLLLANKSIRSAALPPWLKKRLLKWTATKTTKVHHQQQQQQQKQMTVMVTSVPTRCKL